MKRVFLTFLVLVLSLGLGLSTAEAKRLGGGKSFGVQRQAPSQPATATSTPPTSATAPSATSAPSASPAGAVTPQPRRNSWLGPVAGLAAGLGLAALASHLGFGEGFANMLMIALLAMAAVMVFRMLTRRRAQEPAMQYAGAGVSEPYVSEPAPVALPSAGPVVGALPAGFDAETFAREAKLNFLRMQAANDAGNLDDLREFTTPEIFAELQMQLRERGAAANHTEVMDLKAEVLECVEEGTRYVVSVRFHGLLREETGGPAVDFDEIWHLVKPVQGNRGWVVGGIQQRS